ncbi:MAG TPA: hypothetical protein VGP72_12500 [Planctomycetota bacterium]|jgi:hypothetical protein
MNSVCVNHPTREASARCGCCHKPICRECIVKSSGAVFCSQTCASNAARFGNLQLSQPGIFSKIKDTLVGLIGLLFVVAAVVFIGAKVLNIGFFVNLLKSVGL